MRVVVPPTLLSMPLQVAAASLVALVFALGIAKAAPRALPPLAPHQTVVLEPGPYQGPWEITEEGVRLVAKGATLDGGGQGSALVLAAPGIAVEGLTVQNVGKESDFYAPDAAVWLIDCQACRVEGLRAEDVTTGVRIEASPGAVVQGAYLTGTREGPGITVYDSPRFALHESYVANFLDGIYLEYADGAAVLGNEVAKSWRYGLHLMFSRDVELAYNLVRDNRVGSALMYGRNAHYHHNVMRGHRGPLAFGLLVQEQADSCFEHNIVTENTVGMLIISASDNTFRSNEVAHNGFAFVIQRAPGEGASSALLSDNRFFGNLYDVAVDDPEASVALHGNSYDRASPLDLRGDGVSDLPYVPSSSYALLASRQPDLTLFALSPGMLLWEQAEAKVPGLRLMTLADHAAKRLVVEVPETSSRWAGLLLVVLALGVWRWLR